MKLNWSSCLLCLAVLVSCADAARRTSSSGRSRGSNRGTGSRGKAKAPAPSSASSGLSHEGLAGLSYSGYGQAAAKPKPKPAGWNVDTGETAVRKNTGSQSQSYPTNNQQSHSYPSNGQQSHSYPSSGQQSHSYPSNGQQSPVNNQQSHSYPASSGLSGGAKQAPSYPANNPAGGNGAQQSHSYPAGSGLSGHGAGAPPAYPAQTGAVPPYSQSGYPHPQQHYPAGNYPGGGNPSYTGGFPNNGQQNPGYSQPGPGGFGNVGGYGGGLGGGFGGGYNNKYGGGYGPPSRTGGNVLTGLGIAGAGVGTILTGLALYNLARGGSNRYVHHYHDKPTSSEEKLDPQTEAALSNLVNCTLTVQSADTLEVLLIPCELANSFAPNAAVKKGASDGQTPIDSNVNCTIAIFSKDGTETRTFIPCATLAKLGANATDSATAPPSEQPLQPSQPNPNPDIQPSTLTPIPFIPVQSIQQTLKPAECNPESDPKCLPPPPPITDGDLTVIPLTTESSTVAPAA